MQLGVRGTAFLAEPSTMQGVTQNTVALGVFPMDYETEEQQVEAIKRWWADNGRAVIAGVVIGAALIGGWRFWQYRSEQQAIAASDGYSRTIEALDAGDTETLNKLAEELKDDHGGSLYASYSALAAASQAAQAGELDEAARQFDWVAGNAPLEDVRTIARIRLARVMGAQGNADGGLEILPAKVPDSFVGLLEEVRGDLYLIKGDTDAARTAYETASSSDFVPNPEALSMKIDDLAVPGANEGSDAGDAGDAGAEGEGS